MPTIYGEDKVAQAVGDHALGQMGVRTGSVANSIGYADYEHRQRAARASSSSGPLASSQSSGSSYVPYRFIKAIEDSIPRWILVGLGLLTASAFIYAGVQYEFFPPMLIDGKLDWGGLIVTAIFTFLSYAVGAILVPLALRLLDLGLKLLVLVVCFLLVVGGIYLVFKLIEVLA